MPALKSILQRYGETNSSLSVVRSNTRETLATASHTDLKALMESSSVSGEEGMEKLDMLDRLIEKANTIEICAAWAQQTCPFPKCVCGGFFQRVDAVERYRRSPNGERCAALSDEDIFRLLQHLQQHNETIIICDICEESVPVVHPVWTCQNRTSTILHATSYDICDRCFV